MTTVTSKDKDGDQVMSITKETKKKDKKRKNKNKASEEDDAHKKVRFDLTQNKVTEFFKHGKVATRTLAYVKG